MTTVPTSVDEAKKIGVDLLEKKGGELLSKISGMSIDPCVDMRIDMRMHVGVNMRWTCAMHRWKPRAEAVILSTGTSMRAGGRVGGG